MPEATEVKTVEEELLAALEDSQDALVWASGSPDFATGGRARRGWLRGAQPALERATAAIAVAKAARNMSWPHADCGEQCICFERGTESQRGGP